jgi:hypothetical protein
MSFELTPEELQREQEHLATCGRALAVLGDTYDRRSTQRIAADLGVDENAAWLALSSLAANGFADTHDADNICWWWRTALGGYVADINAALEHQ